MNFWRKINSPCARGQKLIKIWPRRIRNIPSCNQPTNHAPTTVTPLTGLQARLSDPTRTPVQFPNHTPLLPPPPIQVAAPPPTNPIPAWLRPDRWRGRGARPRSALSAPEDFGGSLLGCCLIGSWEGCAVALVPAIAGSGRMDTDGRLRRALAAFGGGDVWDLVDAALASAAPAELRARRDGIVERLYAGAVHCRNCDAPSPPPPPRQTAEVASPASPEEDADVDGLGEDEGDEGASVGSKILAIRDFLEDPDQSGDELVSLLQNLADMDITYKALQETDIGRHVNGLRKHPSGEVRQLVKLLVRKWKEIVDGWVRLHNSGGDGGSSILTDGESPEKTQGKSYQNAQVSDLKYSPSPQRHNGLSSERSSNNNGFESTMERRRASPAPTYHNPKQKLQNSSSNYSTTSSSAPARTMREQKDNHLDLERLDSARKRLQENYQEAQNAKKQRTMQVLDIHDIPKPKSKNTFIRKSGGGGLPARHP